MSPIDISKYRRIVVLTGAGVSTASGLPAFRGAGGLSTDHVQWASDAANLPTSLPHLWELYGGLRKLARRAEPNATHRAIADMEREWGEGRSITVVTQNIDGLHQKAGSREVIELHGSVLRSRCSRPDCSLVPFDDSYIPDTVPVCTVCDGPLRPDIVLFNEQIPSDAEWRVKRSLRDCDLFIAVGTSGSVAPASGFVRGADYAGARTILVNLTPMEPRNPYFKEEYLGRAEELLPTLLRFQTL